VAGAEGPDDGESIAGEAGALEEGYFDGLGHLEGAPITGTYVARIQVAVEARLEHVGATHQAGLCLENRYAVPRVLPGLHVRNSPSPLR